MGTSAAVSTILTLVPSHQRQRQLQFQPCLPWPSWELPVSYYLCDSSDCCHGSSVLTTSWLLREAPVQPQEPRGGLLQQHKPTVIFMATTPTMAFALKKKKKASFIKSHSRHSESTLGNVSAMTASSERSQPLRKSPNTFSQVGH